MKVVFLDFDGVLNHQYWYMRRIDEVPSDDIVSQYPFYEFDPKSIEQLNRIVLETKAVVIVSSTWRIGRTPEQLQDILDKVGFVGSVFDTTPSFYASGTDNNDKRINYTVPRGCEIEWWLETIGLFHRIDWSKERQLEYLGKAMVKNYVILDDDSDMLYSQREHFVKTSTMSGLTESIADKCIEILNTPLIDLYYERKQ